MDCINRYLWLILVVFFGQTSVECFDSTSSETIESSSSEFLDTTRFLGNLSVSMVSPTKISTTKNTRGRIATSIITSSLYPSLYYSKASLEWSSSTSLSPTTTTRLAASKSTLPTTNSSVNNPHGFCAQYTGNRCRDVLRQTLTEYNETERYFDKKQGMKNTESFLVTLLSEIGENPYSDERCKRFIEVAICQYTLPPCLSNGKPVSFCGEDCVRLAKECKVLLNRLIGSASLLTKIQNITFAHLPLPTNCSQYPFRKKNESCVYFGLFDHSTSSKPSSSTNITLWLFIGTVVFIITIIAAIMVIVSLKCRQSKKKGEHTEMDILDNETSTMKERVRESSRPPLLSGKIAEMYDPEKLIQISLDRIEYVSDLGEGQFGLVFEGMAVGLDDTSDPLHKTQVAVKTLKTDTNENCKEEFEQEVALMSILDHPNIVRLLGVATKEEPYCMIFEFMDLGDLNQFLRKAKPLEGEEETLDLKLSCDDFIKMCSQVASGMFYLASLHFVHRDLAARNCLVAKDLTVKIADFGLSRDIYSSDYYKVRGDAMLPIRWMPPEALLQGRFTVKSDIYSYGVLMWEIFTYGLQPFYGYSHEEVISFAKEAALLGQPDDCPTHIYDLMRDCWSRSPEKRPDFDTIIKRLVKNPPHTLKRPSGNASESDAMGNTVVQKPPDTSNQPKDTYQTPGSIINVGFVPDAQSETESPANHSQESVKIDQSVV